MKKKTQNPKPLENTREEENQNNQISEYEFDFMQILRSQRLSQREIARLTGVSQATVCRHTQNIRFPSGTDVNISLILRQLVIRTVIDAWRDKGINGREYALTIEKYIGALKSIEDLRLGIILRDELITLERIMSEEKLPQKALEVLQARYDRMNEELKG